MTEITPTPQELIATFNAPIDIEFQLPDPEDDTVDEQDFQAEMDRIWKVCDRFDLQTDIWRGRVLKAVRDREKKGGEGRGSGFLNWLKQREITKSQAYALIQLANSADTLLASGELDPESINNFSKRAFVETAKAEPEVQKMITEAALNGDRITRREVRQLGDQWLAMSSDLLPDEVKEKAANGGLPSRYLAPLVKEMEKLPESHQQEIKKEAAENPEVDNIKVLTTSARNLSKYLDSAAQVQAFQQTSLDLEMALEEALRLDCLNTAADLVKQAIQLEQTVAKLYTTWRKLGNLADRLYVDTGASNPHLRSMLTSLDCLTGDVIEVPLDETREHLVRLKIIGDSPDS